MVKTENDYSINFKKKTYAVKDTIQTNYKNKLDEENYQKTEKKREFHK